MVKIILLVLFYLTFPLVIIWMCKRWSLLKHIGSIGVAYLIGLALGSSGLFPDGSEAYKLELKGKTSLPGNQIETLIANGTITHEDKFVNQIAATQDLIPAAAILIAFPLLLFSMNFRRWLKFASKGFLSIILGLVAGIVVVTTGFFIWKDTIPESWKLAGMFEGMYTGGTANFVAIQVALQVDPSLFLIANTYDIIVGAFLVLFFITIAPKIFRFILPAYTENNNHAFSPEDITLETKDPDDFTGILQKKNIVPLLSSIGISLLIVAISAGLSFALPMLPQMPVVIFSITILGILASMIKKINRIDRTFQLGMYLILVFSLTVASMADLETMATIKMASLIMFISWCYFGSLILHLILAKIFRIDADNFLITSTALIFSPPFVPLVAKSLKNKDVMVTGITGGLIGLMLGNIFGIALAYFLKGF